jgi:hypothetical protein
MKFSPCPISLVAALCASLLFSCSSDSGSSPPAPSPESSSSSAGVAWNYCVFPEMQLCLRGTYYECQSGGLLSNECPYGSSSSSVTVVSSSSSDVPSSSSAMLSSSSLVVVSSSSSVALSSSSITVISSSSSEAPSSSSAMPSSSSVVVISSSSSVTLSSSSVIPSSSSNITVCKDKLGRYLYCDWSSGISAGYNNCYALDPEYSDLEEPTCENLIAHCDKNGNGGSALWKSTPYTGALFAGPYIEIDDDSFSCKEGGRDKYGDPWGKVLTGPYKLGQIEL